jgi:hypothetical protein
LALLCSGGISAPDALRIVNARTALETLARNSEAALRSEGDDAEVVHVLVGRCNGEGANDTTLNGRVALGNGHPLAEGIDETVLVVSVGSQGLTRCPASVFVDERALRNDDGFASAVLDGPEEIGSRGGVVVPDPLSRCGLEGFSADPTLSLDGLESKSVVAVVGSGEDTGSAVQDGACAGSGSISLGHVDSVAVDGLDEGLGGGREDGAVADHEFDLASDSASRRGAEGDRLGEGLEGSLGVDASRGSKGGHQGSGGGVEAVGDEGRTSVIGINNEQLILIGLETFSDADGDTVGVEGRARSGVGVGEGLDGTDVGVEGNGRRVVGRVVVAVLLVLAAGDLVGILAESGDAVSRDEFASGVAGAAVGVTEGRARLLVADRLGVVDGISEPLAESLGVALALIGDGLAARLKDAVAGDDVELALRARRA